MIGDPRQKDVLSIAGGMSLQVVGTVLLSAPVPGLLWLAGILLTTLGMFLMLRGCFGIARHKGYPAVLGLLGLFGCLGLMILAALPDRGFD
jgi:hypothetical protein